MEVREPAGWARTTRDLGLTIRVGLGWVASHGRIGPGYAHTKGPKARYTPGKKQQFLISCGHEPSSQI